MIESLNGEEWRDITGYEGIYQISNIGRVKSLEREYIDCNGVKYHIKDRLMRPCLNKKGYFVVNLRNNKNNKSVLVHRLVAETFIAKVVGKEQVNHIDGNKRNNNITNLEWCTNEENMEHARRNSLNVKKISKKVCKIDKYTGELLNEYESISQACLINHLDKNCKPSINRCCNHIKGYTSAFGYRWMYSDEFFGIENSECNFCNNKIFVDTLIHSLRPFEIRWCPVCRKKLNKE